MFDKEYSFKGTHAERVIKLTAKFDDKNQLFNRNLDVYIMAPIVGFLYQRKSEANTGETTKIFTQQLTGAYDDLLFNYRLIMLLDKNNEPSMDERVNKAFRYYGSEKARNDEELYEQYVRGGIDQLYEKLIEPSRTLEDYMKNLYDFMEEIDERYNQEISADRIKELCALAKK